MKPLVLSADQVRISCQADAFLTHMVNERFSDIAADSQWHVGFHPFEGGIRMNVGVKLNDESFMVRRPFKPFSSTSAIYYGCAEMVDELGRSVDSISPPEEEGDINQEYTKKHWAWPHLPPKGLEPDLGDLSDWTPDKDDHDVAYRPHDSFESHVDQYIADGEDDDDPEYLDFLNNQGQDD